MNRMDRLFAIVLMLQSRGRVRAQDIAARFDISERTVYRDMQALIQLGVPLVSLPGEGYELMAGFTLPPLLLAEDEATALFTAGKLLSQYADGTLHQHIETALEKVGAVLSAETRAQVTAIASTLDFYPPDQPIDLDEPYLRRVRHAIRTHRVLHIAYHSYRQDEITRRDVEPHLLTFANGAWYLQAYCQLRRDMRVFRLSRIQHIEDTGATFTPRIVIPEQPPLIEVRVIFDPPAATWVQERQHYGYTRTESDEADRQLFVYHVEDLREIKNWLFGWGASAEVVHPIALRDALRQEAQSLINKLT